MDSIPGAFGADWHDDVGIWDLKTWSIFGSRNLSSFAGGLVNFIQGWGCSIGLTTFGSHFLDC